MADETYYSLLEISETASAAEIKTAYLRIVREVHPDRLANAPSYWQRQAEEKTKEINEAYTVLSNREKRCLYDAQLASYRGSRTSANGNSQSSAPRSPSSTPQGSQTTSGPQSTSGGKQQPAQQSRSSSSSSSSSSQQHQAARNSAPPPYAASQSYKPPRAPALNGGQRSFIALIGGILAYRVAGAFWNSSSIGAAVFFFLLATALLFGIACLYQQGIAKLFTAVGLSRPRNQLWASIGMIAFLLAIGKTNNLRSSVSAPQHLSPQKGLALEELRKIVNEVEPTANRNANEQILDKYGNPAPTATYHISDGTAYCEDWTLAANRKWQLHVEKCDLPVPPQLHQQKQQHKSTRDELRKMIEPPPQEVAYGPYINLAAQSKHSEAENVTQPASSAPQETQTSAIAPRQQTLIASAPTSEPITSLLGRSSFAGKMAWVSCSGLDSRSSLLLFENENPSTTVGSVKCGAQVTIQQDDNELHWSRVSTTRGVTGWIGQRYLETNVAPPDPNHLRSSIDCSILPGRESLYLSTLDNRATDEKIACGVAVKILGRLNGLYNISTADGQEGWIQSKYVK
jgi:curved DNA-binding protein CbpA